VAECCDGRGERLAELGHEHTAARRGGFAALSNIYLHAIDGVWQAEHGQFGELARYADDFVLMSCRESAAKEALAASRRKPLSRDRR
jgi:hypothetical protein